MVSKCCTVNPGPIDTPFFDKADNDYTYRAHLPKWMFISPEDLARRIWNNVGYKTREINVPGYVAYLGWAYQVIPGLGDWAIKKFFDSNRIRRTYNMLPYFREIAEFSSFFQKMKRPK